MLRLSSLDLVLASKPLGLTHIKPVRHSVLKLRATVGLTFAVAFVASVNDDESPYLPVAYGHMCEVGSHAAVLHNRHSREQAVGDRFD